MTPIPNTYLDPKPLLCQSVCNMDVTSLKPFARRTMRAMSLCKVPTKAISAKKAKVRYLYLTPSMYCYISYISIILHFVIIELIADHHRGAPAAGRLLREGTLTQQGRVAG